MKGLTFVIASILMLTSAFLIIPSWEVQAAVQTKITRSQAEQRALKMINYTWTYSRAKNDTLASDYTSDVIQPSQFKNVTTAKMKGIPYNWGGSDSLDSHSSYAPWSNFQGAVSKGAYMGNVNLNPKFGLIPNTAGIDCSGFVQAVFNIHATKLSTSTMFDTYFTKIKLNSIQHMDILDRPGDHVVIFDRWGTLNGVNGAFTYESTPDQVFGGIQGTKKYFLVMSDLNNGYIPGRYRYLSGSAPAKTVNLKGKYGKVANVTTSAYMRAMASASGAPIGTIPKGTRLYLKDYSNGFYRIGYASKSGWISASRIVATS